MELPDSEGLIRIIEEALTIVEPKSIIRDYSCLGIKPVDDIDGENEDKVINPTIKCSTEPDGLKFENISKRTAVIQLTPIPQKQDNTNTVNNN